MIPIPTAPGWNANDLLQAHVPDSRLIATGELTVETRSGNTDTAPVTSPRLISRPALETPMPFWRTSLNQAVRELFSQSLGRLTGAAAFTGLSRLGRGEASSTFACVLGALSAGVCSVQLLRHQIGTASTAQKTGIGLASMAAVAAGGVITGYASLAAVSMIASGSFVAAVASGAVRNTEDPQTGTESGLDRYPDENIALGLKILGFAAASAPFLIGFLVNPSFWLNHEAGIGNRNLSVAIEALSIELTKATVNTVGISVNRDALIFEEKFKAAMIGLLPYVIASVLCNSVAGGLLQAELNSDQFTNLILPALVGALANCVKGAANAAAARYVSDPDATWIQGGEHTLRPGQGLQWPISAQLTPKVMLRYLMISCRDSLFFGLKKAGLHPELANGLSMMVYASFAQFRDLSFDLMQGQGWTEPVLTRRPPVVV